MVIYLFILLIKALSKVDGKLYALKKSMRKFYGPSDR